MPVFELQTPDGKTFQVDAPDMQSAGQALSHMGTPQPEQPDTPWYQKAGQAVDDMARLAANGLTLGYADQLAGYMGGQGADAERQVTQQARDRAGIPGMAAEIGAGFIPAAGAARVGLTAARLVPQAATGLGRLAGLTAAGAADGAVYGGLNAAGNGQDVAQGAAIGGAFGGAATPLVETGAALMRPVTARFAPQGAANRILNNTMRSAGQTPASVSTDLAQAQAEGQGVYTAADAMGHPAQRLVSTVARTPNAARTEVIDQLERRQAGQGRRVANALSEGFAAPDTALQREASLTKARNTTADQLYGAARQTATDVDTTNTIQALDNMLGGGQVKRAMGIHGDQVDNALLSLRDRLASPDNSAQVVGFDELLRIKSDLRDEIQAARQGGRSNRARMLGQVLHGLDADLENASSGYRAANDTYARMSRPIGAVDQGRQAAMRGRSEDTIPAFQRMSPEEQSAYRAGYSDPLIAQTQQSAQGVNKARPLISDATAAEFPAFAAPGQGGRLGRRIAREQRMFETRNTAIGGSRTAENLSDDAALSVFDPSVLGHVLSGNWFGAIKSAGTQALSSLRGQPASVRERIGRALMETDPVRAHQMLNASLRQVTRNEGRRQAIARALMAGSTSLAISATANRD